MPDNQFPLRTRRATTLERRHFTELTQPIIDYIRANAEGPNDCDSNMHIVDGLHSLLSELIRHCRRFGYCPSKLGLLVAVDPNEESLGTPLTEAQEADIIMALEGLYTRLMGKP